MSDYWKTCIEEALSEIGITATEKQTSDLIEWVEGAHENYGMAHGHHCIPDPVHQDLEKTKKALEREQNKTVCRKCNGLGYFVSLGPVHSSKHDCPECYGRGFIY